MILSTLTNLNGIPNYIQPTSGTTFPAFGNSLFAYAIYDNGNGVITTACGQYTNATDDVPLAYLPAKCSCTKVSSFVTNGTPC